MLLYVVKKYWYLVLIAAALIGGYFISKRMLDNSLIEKEVVYQAPGDVNEASIVWGINYLQMPPKEFWPKGSVVTKNLVESRMGKKDGAFFIKLKLPANTQLDYWIVQKRYEYGKLNEVWDQGRPENEHFTMYFYSHGLFRPGYLLFLAGFVPLVVLFAQRKKIVRHATSSSPVEVKGYVPQFDSLRAVAVLLVIFHHWFHRSNLVHFLHFGAFGVDMFFVLSGFLITRILLHAKRQNEKRSLTKAQIFKNFYVRRSLRIFPIYYLLLFVLWAFQNQSLQEEGLYYLTYTSNWLFFSQQFYPEKLAHLWSLSVEEQFYLLWPWLIVFINRKYLPLLIGTFIIFGVTARNIIVDHDWWVIISTPACFDAFGIGALLAYVVVYQSWFINHLERRYGYLAFFSVGIFVLALLNVSFLPDRTVHAMLAITLIYYCLFKNNNRVLNYILNNKFLIAFGKVSYGVYLYHLLVPGMWEQIIKQLSAWHLDPFFNEKIPVAIQPTWWFLQEFGFLVLLSFLSWKLIEKPMNGLKKYFEYKELNEKENAVTAVTKETSNIEKQAPVITPV